MEHHLREKVSELGGKDEQDEKQAKALIDEVKLIIVWLARYLREARQSK